MEPDAEVGSPTSSAEDPNPASEDPDMEPDAEVGSPQARQRILIPQVRILIWSLMQNKAPLQVSGFEDPNAEETCPPELVSDSPGPCWGATLNSCDRMGCDGQCYERRGAHKHHQCVIVFVSSSSYSFRDMSVHALRQHRFLYLFWRVWCARMLLHRQCECARGISTDSSTLFDGRVRARGIGIDFSTCCGRVVFAHVASA